ncbi:hypothetical protein BXZ70DRAFT_1006565 [Cristinia sonorae]|uniref:Protein CPL1-like domain-containing protein n=1 Tax=Cristinia sonorae TaxID=1940300 RepID=A0A8K0UT29_9AGAR|nr:hypothetical protein BXZ70DRAFT_1006565 [Cristinia sonorae]
MTVLSRFLFVALALPFVLAHGNGDSKPSGGDKSCNSGNFYFKQADCCVPRGGQPSPPKPPQGTQCPSNGWDWNIDKSCCVPHQPPDQQAPPSCNKGWGWLSDKLHCTPNSPPSPPRPAPPPSSPPSPPPPSKPPTTPSKPSDCGDGLFFWGKKNCCLPRGGPPTPPPPPPSGTNCPSDGWSWSPLKGCCTPHSPSPPTPRCFPGWDWDDDVDKCLPTRSNPPPSKPPTTPPPPSKPDDCGDGQFWWGPKKCCLPHGGPPQPPPPPPGSECPPSGWSWFPGKGCCVPHHPPGGNQPPPQCPRNWSWNDGDSKCHPNTPTPPGPPPPRPSGYHQSHRRSGLKARAHTLCPFDQEACPIKGANSSSAYECLDTTQELTSCGGCTSLGKGQDCTAIIGAWNVKCDVSQGGCKVLTCKAGYQVSADGKSCAQR